MATARKKVAAKAKATKARARARAPRARASAVPSLASVQENIKKFGIYLDPKQRKVVRINSPYWFPPAPQWVFLTPEVNMTLLKIRELSKEKGLVKDADSVQWTSIPPKPEDLKRWEAEERAKKAQEAKEAKAKAKAEAKAKAKR